MMKSNVDVLAEPMGIRFVELRQAIERAVQHATQERSVADLIDGLEAFRAQTDEERAILLGVAHEVAIRLLRVRQTEPGLKRSSFERVRNELGGCLSDYELKLWDAGLRAEMSVKEGKNDE